MCDKTCETYRKSSTYKDGPLKINDLSGVYFGDNNANLPLLYTSLFNCIPNRINIELSNNVEKRDEMITFLNDFSKNVITKNYSNGKTNSSTEIRIINEYEIIIFVSKHNSGKEIYLDVYYNKENEIIEKIERIATYASNKINKIGLVMQDTGGPYVSYKELNYDIDIDFDYNYNDDFKSFNKYINSNLTKNGIILLYGEPGSGKSTYIKHLIHTVDTKFIYLPISVARNLDSPGLMSFAIENTGSTIIIEDCEELIVSKDGRPSGLSTILNFADGILSNIINLKFILTFNEKGVIKNIDPAVMRHGRLIGKYHFGKLNKEKAIALFKKIYPDKNDWMKINDEKTLGEIYNFFTDFGKEEEKDVQTYLL